MGISERRLRHREEVKASILHAAKHLVKMEGWQALSIRKIADVIEYSVPVIYEYFDNKEALLFELSLEGFHLLKKDLDTALVSSATPEEQLKKLAGAYWDFAFKNREYYQLMYGIGIPCSSTGKLKPELNIFGRLIGNSMKDIDSQQKMSEHEIDFRTSLLWCMLHGLISIVMMRNPDVDYKLDKEVMEESISAFIAYLRVLHSLS
ncbi:MAG TPA: TetR/AcrR family transcriptional regulator [Chitinophaga sp.]|uniref:TetR/AcrR family transcriptional regulator n=1 Tax=Chitinophaga sp. TaxID=1869181 RepID=UPI002CD0A4AB|nr:TetR/AcrR family transcriptional regulator [Chitinophaga sp.]HVI46083.1 TetR/AcrR family transcriptional regulator [Chitinophaga sp.]